MSLLRRDERIVQEALEEGVKTARATEQLLEVYRDGAHKKIEGVLELATHALAGLTEFQRLCDREIGKHPNLEEYVYGLQQSLVISLCNIVQG